MAKGGATLAPINEVIWGGVPAELIDKVKWPKRKIKSATSGSTSTRRSRRARSPSRSRWSKRDDGGQGPPRRRRVARHHQALRRAWSPTTRSTSPSRRRGARAPRRERRRQVHPDADPLRADPPRRRRDPHRWPAGSDPLAARRDRGRDRDGHAALRARAAHDGGRERRPRPPTAHACARRRRREWRTRPSASGSGDPTRVSPTFRWASSSASRSSRRSGRDCRVLILDEPTAVLVPQERALFATLRRLRARAWRCLHQPQAVRGARRSLQRVTVLRRGEVVGTRATSDTDDASAPR